MYCMLNKYYLNGGSYFVGGVGVLVDVMMFIIEDVGGVVFYSVEVEEIFLDVDIVVGVRLVLGECVKVKMVVSNVGV